MLAHLSSTESPKTSAYFAHSSTFILLLTLMGIARDEVHLRADNYFEMQNRRFKTSEISPFAANLVAVRYECPNEDEIEKIKFFLNEKSLKFDWCTRDLCNLSNFKKRYSLFVDANCPNIFCTVPTD